MKLKNAITLSAMALTTMLGITGLYAQQKKDKRYKEIEQSCQKPNYGKPSEVKTNEGAFKTRPLAYDYGAASSHIDTEAVYIHFSGHYAGYLSNLNKAVERKPKAQKAIEQLLGTLDMSNAALRNNAEGYYNRSLYLELILPKGGGTPTGALAVAVDRDFGSSKNLKKAFSGAGVKRLGSGQAWLVVSNDKLQVVSIVDQDTPLMLNLKVSGTPILTMDVWEHAYHLKYQNKRADYITDFFDVVDWTKVTQKYERALKQYDFRVWVPPLRWVRGMFTI